jgi:uncharacterized protein (DUF58 family)
MVVTRRGWVVAGSAVTMVIAGWLLGVYELHLLAGGTVAVLGACIALVLRSRAVLDVTRELHPVRVHAGSPSRVELRARNRGDANSPLLTLRDAIGSTRTATVVLQPLDVGEEVGASYRLPTERRGVVRVGPLMVEVSDPFGLAAIRTEAAPRVDLTVWPAVEEVPPLPHATGDELLGAPDYRRTTSSRGDDFYSLRPYVLGDDLRRVHWRSTARRGVLLVRQDEMAWQGRSTVLLDTRSSAHTAETFERAVSAAASVVLACSRRGHLVRLLTTDGQDTAFGSGRHHVEAILERLAAADLTDDARSLDRAVVTLRRPGGSGALAVLLGGAGDPDAVSRLARGYRRVVAVSFAPDDTTPFGNAWRFALARRPVRA